MAQYFRNFTGQANGAAVENAYYPYYTPTTGVIDTTTFAFPVYKETHSINNEHPLVFNEVPTDTTLEILAKVRMDTVTPGTTNDYQADFLFRGSGGPTSRNAYTVNMLRGQFINTEGYLGNTSFTWGAGLNFTFSANVWYWVRTRMEGNVAYYKAWQDGSSEPANWMGSATDSSNRIPGAGWAGIGSWKGVGTRYWAQVGIGTGGSSAPASGLDTSLTVNSLAVATQESSPVLDTHTDITEPGGGYFIGGYGSILMGLAEYGAGNTFYGNPLSIDNLNVATLMDNVTLAQNYTLAVNALAVATLTTSPTLIADIALVMQNLAVATQEQNIDLVQNYQMVLQDLLVATQEDNITLITELAALADNMTSSVLMDNVSLMQQHLLAVNNLVVATTTVSPVVTENRTLAVDSLNSLTQVSAVDLVQQFLLEMQSLLVASQTDNVTLAQLYNLVVQNLAVATQMSNLVVITPLQVQSLNVKTVLDEIAKQLDPIYVPGFNDSGSYEQTGTDSGIIIPNFVSTGELEQVETDSGIYVPNYIQKGNY